MKPSGALSFGFALIFGVVCSCGRGPEARFDPRVALAKFSERIAQADHVVVAKLAQSGTPSSLTLNGADARRVVKAVGSSEVYGDVPPGEKTLKLDFFQGTDLLGTLLTSEEGCCWPQAINQTYLVEYWDSTGTLSNLARIPAEKWH